MEFNKNLYELRKQKGVSQEQLADRLNVSRQTLSKWELGTSTPDMEKLIMLSDYFEISLDELVSGKGKEKEKEQQKECVNKEVTLAKILDEKVLTYSNKQKVKFSLKIVGIILGIVFAIDLLSFIIYVALHGLPQY